MPSRGKFGPAHFNLQLVLDRFSWSHPKTPQIEKIYNLNPLMQLGVYGFFVSFYCSKTPFEGKTTPSDAHFSVLFKDWSTPPPCQ